MAILRYAVDRVPFYRSLNLDPECLNTLDDLQRFPVIRKADLQERPTDFLSRDFDPAALHRSRSSGATGQPTVTYFCDTSWITGKYALKARRLLTDVRKLPQRLLC